MEDLRTVMRLLRKDMYLASIDLKDAYFIVPVHEAHRKFLRFSFQNNLFEFTCLPFGLASAPYVFTKLIKPVIQYLRSNEILCVNYLDDLLIMAESEKACFQKVQFVSQTLLSLGFVINNEKSNFIPNKRCKFLGVLLDTSHMKIELTPDKKERYHKLIKETMVKPLCKIQHFAKFIGTLVSACPAVKYGWLYMKNFEREKTMALQKNNMNYNASMKLSYSLRNDFIWWLQNILISYNDIKSDNFHLELYTDASLSGWGCFSQGEKAHGWWTNVDKDKHINLLELEAVFLGLKCFARCLSNVNILIRCDNTTAISCLNRMGSVQHQHLNFITRKIWHWCESRNIWIFASYISSQDNFEADRESRTLLPETEWSLSQEAFKAVTDFFGYPDIDLFASKDNNKCEKYISWFPDPGAWGTDAFTISWTNLFFYAFPPFALILRVLQKTLAEKAEGILVAPYWPSQAWYPLMLKLSIDKPLFMRPSDNLLTCPYSGRHHPLASNLTLVAVKLSGKRSC